MKEVIDKIYNKFNGETSLFFAGQAGYIFKNKKGKILGLDLYLTDSCKKKYGFKRLMPKILNPEELRLDVLVCTHEHYDHFDYDAVPILLSNPSTKLVAAKDCKKLVEKLGIKSNNIVYLGEGDSYCCSEFSIKAVFCDHGEDTPDAIGVVLRLDDICIYIAGDTCLRLDKAGKILEDGPFDVMIAPINGKFGNMNEYEMVQLCAAIKPGLVIPCHYWNFAEHGGNPGAFVEKIEKDLPEQRYMLLSQGEMISLKR